MQNTAAKIQCLNHNCQAFNSQKNDFCHKCRTPIVKRYLWAIGRGIDVSFEVGELIDNRYLAIEGQIVLDTKPGLTPLVPEKIPKEILPYLQLFCYRLHVPQIYGYVSSHRNQPESEIWLLEYGTIPIDNSGELKYSNLLPQIARVWPKATALRQLNWLWQMARLWDCFKNKGVASSLLNPSLLRANGATIQLLELQLDTEQRSLSELGDLWLHWAPKAAPMISQFLQELSSELRAEKIENSERLIDILDEAMRDCGKSQRHKYEIFALTDSGPSRTHNEDSCFPPHSRLVKVDSDAKALAIVCDGIGGHAGGEIASQLAIDTIQKAIEELPLCSEESSNSDDIVDCLSQLVCNANDIISERNDSEKRHERQRMGTTLVMSVARAHQMYLTNVGDSRIYWISATGCHQVTVDDDLASREVQLGFAFYRDIIEFPHSGALVQALGMESSKTLNPTVERLILDEDCVFLLCSDGLSDYGRVEQYWRGEILPILRHQTDLASAAKRLIQIANQENGHDNVTVALVHCQIEPLKAESQTSLSLDRILSTLPARKSLKRLSKPHKEECSPKSKSRLRLLPMWLLLGIMGVFLGLGAISYVFPTITNEISSRRSKQPNAPFPAEKSKESPTPNLALQQSDRAAFEVGDTIEITEEGVLLWPTSEKTAKSLPAIGKAPEGSVLKVLETSPASPGMLLEVCQLPPSHNLGSGNKQIEKALPVGARGWVQAEVLERRFDPVKDAGKCKSANSIEPNRPLKK